MKELDTIASEWVLPEELQVAESLNDEWLDALSRIYSLTDHQKSVTRQMFADSLLRRGFFTMKVDGVAVACGIAVLEGDHAGLYDIVVSEQLRGQGVGKKLVEGMLAWSKEHGAKKSYLLVVADNERANRLYDRLGYHTVYETWYRVKGR